MRPTLSWLRLVRKVTASILLTLGASFCIVTFTPLVKLIVQATDQDWYGGKGQVLVVLGGSMLVPGTGTDATLGHDTYLRSVYAAWIMQRQSFRFVVVTGDSGAAEQMARFLGSNGVAESAILIENRAASTYENALYTRRLLEERYGVSRVPEVVVLTSDYHSWRARRVFQHLGFRTQTIPVPDILKRSSFWQERWPAFLLVLSEFGKDVVYAATGKI
jgi:uncharacterized SAM-binding protein YcdF (DUF218 family)